MLSGKQITENMQGAYGACQRCTYLNRETPNLKKMRATCQVNAYADDFLCEGSGFLQEHLVAIMEHTLMINRAKLMSH